MKHQQNVKKLHIVLFFLLIFLLLSNLVSSQLVSPLYFRLVSEDKDSVALYLQKIRGLPIFGGELEKYKAIYGGAIEEEVLRPEMEKNAKIRSLEEALKRNSKSRDVLYSLYLLYKERGDEKTAQGYLDRAQELDPNIIE